MIVVAMGPATWNDLHHVLKLRRELPRPEDSGMEWVPLRGVLADIAARGAGRVR